MSKKTEMENAFAEWQDAEERAANALLEYIEERAREILAENAHLNEYVQGMGTFSFTTGEYLKHPEVEAYDKELYDLIMEHHCKGLCITGVAMRFTADGPRIEHW